METVEYSEEPRWCWSCPNCGWPNDEHEDPKEFGNNITFCEKCKTQVDLYNK